MSSAHDLVESLEQSTIAGGIVHGTTSPSTRLDLAKWADAAMLEMKGDGQIICNAWKRHGYGWFVNDTVDQDAGGNDDGAVGVV